MNEQLIHNFSVYYPQEADHVIAYCYNNQIHELIFILDNNRVGYYDENENLIHYIFEDRNSISNDEYKKELGRRLSKLIWYKTTQVELSRDTGITQHMISHYVTGRSVPSLFNIMKIANALNCSVDIFMFEFERSAIK